MSVFWCICYVALRKRNYVCANIVFEDALMFVYRCMCYVTMRKHKFVCANIYLEHAEMFVFPLYTFPKRTHTYVLRPYPLDVPKTWPFSENSFISLSYFCEQLCLPCKRGACVGCEHNNMAETHTRGRNIAFYVLFSCGYRLISTLTHVFEGIHVLCFDVYVGFGDVSVVFLTCTCFSFDKAVRLSYIYITIDTHAWYYSSACVNFTMYVFLLLTFALFF